MPVSFTTDLPEAEGFALDATEPSELAAEWAGVLNNGEYRLELRDDDPDGNHPNWEHEATVDWSAGNAHTITNLIDGEQYSIRIRTQTEYATGAWLSAEEITKLIAADLLNFEGVTETELTLSWRDNSDFRGSYLIYRKRSGYDYGDEGRLIDTLSDNAEQVFDDTVAPETGYEYLVRAQTQWVKADSTASIETASAGLEQRPVPPRGWYAEIDHPSGQIITPQILDGAVQEPRVKDYPRVRLPVPRDDAYLLESYEGATMSVWRNGQRLPVDELEDVEIEPGQVELVGIGGTELEQRIQRDVVQEESHALARDLIESVGYTANVDEPDIEQLVNELLEAAATDEELADGFQTGDLDPFEVQNGRTTTVRTCFTREANDLDASTDPSIDTGVDDASNGILYGVGSSTSELIWSDTTEHTIAADDVGVHIHRYPTSNAQALNIILEVDGTEYVLDSLSGGEDLLGGWRDFANSPFNGDGYTGPDIPAGTDVSLIVRAAGSSGGVFWVDVVTTVCDNQFEYDFDETLDEPQGAYDGPGYHPKAASIETRDAETIYSVRYGYANTVWDGVDGDQKLELSNDGGRTWIEAPNTETLEGQFGDLGASLRLRITVPSASPDGPRNDTPRYDYDARGLESYELRADMDDTSLTLNEPFDGDVADLLTTIAERSDSLWEVRQDGDETTVEWAQPGQRESDDAPSIIDYSVTKHNRRTLRMTVKGGTQSNTETIEAGTGPIDLEEEYLVSGRTTVRDAETGERYQANRDYEMQHGAGVLEIVDAGPIEDGQQLEVEYDYNISGTFEHPEYDGDARTDSEQTISGLSTVRGCELAAKVLVDELSEPRYEASVSIPSDADLKGLLEAFDVDELPGEAQSIYDLDVTPEGLEAQLGSRQRAKETVERIQSTLKSTSERV